MTLNNAQIREYQMKRDRHKKKGMEYVKIAEDCIPFLPSIDDQDLVETFFVTATAACVDGLKWSTAVIGISSSCILYGINVYKEFKKLDRNLQAAINEFELMEFYQMVLEKG
jgi:hypothetical protein